MSMGSFSHRLTAIKRLYPWCQRLVSRCLRWYRGRKMGTQYNQHAQSSTVLDWLAYRWVPYASPYNLVLGYSLPCWRQWEAVDNRAKSIVALELPHQRLQITYGEAMQLKETCKRATRIEKTRQGNKINEITYRDWWPKAWPTDRHCVRAGIFAANKIKTTTLS